MFVSLAVDFIIAFSLGVGIRHWFAQRQLQPIIAHFKAVKDWSETKIRWEANRLINELEKGR